MKLGMNDMRSSGDSMTTNLEYVHKLF